MPPAHLYSPLATPRPDYGRLLAQGIAVAAVALLALWIPVHLSFPLGRDQAIIARVAQTMLDGGWPYVDAWDHKGPGAYLLYAPALALLGPPEVSLYRADLLLLAGMFFVYRSLASRLDLPLAAPLALLTLILCVRNGHWTLAQPDTWIGYLAVAVTALLLHPRFGTRRASLLVVGAAIGFSAMVKPVFAGFLVLPAVAILTAGDTVHARVSILLVVAGFCAAVGLITMPFVIAGHGGALWDAYVAFNVGGHLTRTWQDLGEWLVRFFGTFLIPRLHLGVAAIVLIAVLGFRSLLLRRRREALILGSGWLVALVGVAVQGKAFPYHFMAVHGFTAILAAAFLSETIGSIGAALRDGRAGSTLRRQAVTTGLLLGGAYAALVPHASRTFDWWRLQSGWTTREAFDQDLCQVDYCMPTIRAVGEVVRMHSDASDKIFVWGFDSAVYLAADRQAASRFGFSYPLIGGNDRWRTSARAELLRDLAEQRPRIVVVQTNDFVRLMASRSSEAHLADFPALAQFLTEGYAPLADLDGFRVLKRKD